MKPDVTEFEHEANGLEPVFRDGVVQRERGRDPKNTPIAVIEINLFANLENGAMVTQSYSNLSGLKLLANNAGARIVNIAAIGQAMCESLESFFSNILEEEARPMVADILRSMGPTEPPHDC